MSAPFVCARCCRRTVRGLSFTATKQQRAYASSDSVESIVPDVTSDPLSRRSDKTKRQTQTQHERSPKEKHSGVGKASHIQPEDLLQYLSGSAAGGKPGRYSGPYMGLRQQVKEGILRESQPGRYYAPRRPDDANLSHIQPRSIPPSVPRQEEHDGAPDGPHDDNGFQIQPRTFSYPVFREQENERAPDGSPHRRPNHLSDLEDKLKRFELVEAWAFFQEHYTSKESPAILRPSFQDHAKLRSRLVFHILLSKLTKEWLKPLREVSPAQGIPPPLQIIDHLERLGMLQTNMYAYTMLEIACTLQLALSKDADLLHSEPFAKTALRQLMDLWARLFGRLPVTTKSLATPTKDVEGSPNSPWAFVSASHWQKIRHQKGASTDFEESLYFFVPLAASNNKKLATSVSGSALLTYDLLVQGTKHEHGLPEDCQQYLPFVDSLKHILVATTIDPAQTSMLLRHLMNVGIGMTAETATTVLDRITGEQTRVPISTLAKSDLTDASNMERFAETLVGTLGRALLKQDLDTAEKVWATTQTAFESAKIAHASSPALKLYQHLLLVFLSLRRPQTAIEIWNSMITNGFDPDVRTWTVMMKGCHKARDFRSMESMWERMKRSGIRPDAQAWSTRLYGLFRLNRMQDGFRALDEMGHDWTVAAREHMAGSGRRKKGDAPTDLASIGDASGVPKPNTIILNSAISALASQGSQYISKVLAWGQKFSIEPDVITYNTLINVSLSRGKPEEATSMLKRMSETNIQPDSSTFTVLLNSLFRSGFLSNLSQAAQEEEIMTFVTSMESINLILDSKGYAILIDRLLKEHSNLLAAHRVLAHMAAHNVEPTPHIYTILMTHYFDSTPPDFAAADALWSVIQARTTNNQAGAPDVIFYDRMVEGYARHGEIGPMMTFLARMSKEGKRPGWLAMSAVVKCLAEAGHWDRVREVVVDCRRMEGLLSAGVRGHKGQVEFWELVNELGVVDL